MFIKFLTFFIFSFFSFANKLEIIEYRDSEKEILTGSFYAKRIKGSNEQDFITKSLQSHNQEFIFINSKILMMKGHEDHHYIKFNLKNLSSSENILIAGWFSLVKEAKIYWLENNTIKNKDFSRNYKIDHKNESSLTLYDVSSTINHPIGELRTYIIKANLLGNFAKTNLYISSLDSQIKKAQIFKDFYLLIQGFILASTILIFYFYFIYKKKYYLYLSINLLIILYRFSLSTIFSKLFGYGVLNFFVGWLQSVLSYEFYFDFYNIGKKYKYFRYFSRILQGVFLILVLINLFIGMDAALFLKIRHWIVLVITFNMTIFIAYLAWKRERFAFWFLIARIPLTMTYVNALSEDYLNFTLYPFKVDVDVIISNFTWPILFLAILLIRAREQQAEIEIASNSEEFINSLKGSSNIQEILNKLIVNIRKYVDYDNAIVYIKDNTTYHLLSTPLFKISDEDMEEINKLVNKVPRGEYLISRDISSDPLFNNYINSSYYTSVMIAPLNVVDENVGMIVFLSSKYNAYSNVELGFVKDFAYRAAIITEHHKQLKLISEQRSKIAVEESVRLFQQMVSNEIKSPIYAVKNSIHALRATYEKKHGTLDGDLREYVECMENAVREAVDEVEESLSVISEKSQKFEISYLYDALAYARRICQFEGIDLIEEKNFNPSYIIKGPKKAIRNALRLVFKNALDSVQEIEKEGKIIKIIYEEDGGKLKISIWDNGKGMKKEEADKIFEIFIPGREGRRGQNLMVAKAVVERVNGHIELESEENNYTLVNMHMDVLIK